MTDTFKQIAYMIDIDQDDPKRSIPVLCKYSNKDNKLCSYTEIETKKVYLEIPKNWNIDKIFLLLEKYQKEIEDE